ncbi:hypothetical protein AAKU52_002937 [Pedobacter sp. CG_S7]|uniref:hypothetical protein n=1 Tax=Pedobacter sp. CG_S7 TaxID=3143930 RepID=UPI00339405A2
MRYKIIIRNILLASFLLTGFGFSVVKMGDTAKDPASIQNSRMEIGLVHSSLPMLWDGRCSR